MKVLKLLNGKETLNPLLYWGDICDISLATK